MRKESIALKDHARIPLIRRDVVNFHAIEINVSRVGFSKPPIKRKVVVLPQPKDPGG